MLYNRQPSVSRSNGACHTEGTFRMCGQARRVVRGVANPPRSPIWPAGGAAAPGVPEVP
jgi:hypothetical protein